MILLLLFIYSFVCSILPVQDCTIKIDEKTINFPTDAAEIKETLSLNYQPYTGFFSEQEDGTILITQIRGYKIFPGDDRSKEEEYLKREVVGLVNYFPKSSIELEVLKNDIEEEYKVVFEKEKTIKNKLKEEERNWYFLVQANDCVWLTLKESKRYYIFSIYYLQEDEIDNYLIR